MLDTVAENPLLSSTPGRIPGIPGSGSHRFHRPSKYKGMKLMHKLILAAALAACASSSSAPPSSTPPRHAPAAIAFQPTRFSVVVEGNGPDVILIPGLSSTRDVWATTAGHLKANYRLHLVQLKGFGEAPGPNASGAVLQLFVDELGAYIAAKRLDKPAIVGHSLGGLAALMLAADRPALPGKLMLVDALPFIGTIFGAADVAAITPRAEQMRAMILAQAKTVTPNYATTADCPASLPAPEKIIGNMTNSGAGACHVKHGALASDLKVVAQAMYDAMVTDMRPRLKEIVAPVTVLYPQDDRLMKSAEADALYTAAYAGTPKLTLRRIPGSYHFIMLDQPALFEKELDEFLAR